MSEFASDLHRFGLNPEEPPDQRQWSNLCGFIRALVNNPQLNIGTENSEIVIPQPSHLRHPHPPGYLGRYIISYVSGSQRIYVSPGTVAFVEMYGSTDEDVIPITPTLNGIPLDGPPPEDVPFWDAAGCTAGTRYRVRVVMDRDEPIIDISEDEESDGEMEYDTMVVGYFTLKNPPPGSPSAHLIKDSIEQKWKSDIVWPKEGSSSSSSSSSASSSGDSSNGSGESEDSGDSGGSDKSSAIVPLPGSKHGFTALLTMEAPEVLFEDIIHIPIRQSPLAWPIDPRFILVCELGSVHAISVTTDRPALVGVRVEGSKVFMEINPCGGALPSIAHVKLCGIRKGFAGMRFPPRDREQFEANERHLNSAYPAKDLPE